MLKAHRSYIKICSHPECGEYTENAMVDFCASHQREFRKQETESKKQLEKRNSLLQKAKEKNMEPRKMLKKVSEKREELNKEYFILVEQFKKDNPLCKAKVNEYCTKETEDPHHKLGRGVYLLDISTWLPVCRSCHSYIEAHPKEAKEKGWSESRLATQEPHKI